MYIFAVGVLNIVDEIRTAVQWLVCDFCSRRRTTQHSDSLHLYGVVCVTWSADIRIPNHVLHHNSTFFCILKIRDIVIVQCVVFSCQTLEEPGEDSTKFDIMAPTVVRPKSDSSMTNGNSREMPTTDSDSEVNF